MRERTNVSFDKATPEAVINTLKHDTGLEFVYQKDILKAAKAGRHAITLV